MSGVCVRTTCPATSQFSLIFCFARQDKRLLRVCDRFFLFAVRLTFFNAFSVQFKEISAAYDILSDEETRATYDRYGLKGLEVCHSLCSDTFYVYSGFL